MKISELPDEYRKLAEKRRLEAGVSRTINDLEGSFYWDTTPEGHDFWNAVGYAKILRQLPPIPETSK